MSVCRSLLVPIAAPGIRLETRSPIPFATFLIVRGEFFEGLLSDLFYMGSFCDDEV